MDISVKYSYSMSKSRPRSRIRRKSRRQGKRVVFRMYVKLSRKELGKAVINNIKYLRGGIHV